MATGYDPSKTPSFHERQSSDSFGRNSRSQREPRVWREGFQDLYSSRFEDDTDSQRSFEPRGAGDKNFGNTDEHSWKQGPWSGSNWRAPEGGRENCGRSWTGSYRDRTSFLSPDSLGEGSEATSWRKPSQGDQRTQASVTSRGYPQESHREGSDATNWRNPFQGDQRTLASATSRRCPQESHTEGSGATSWKKPSQGDQRTQASVTSRGCPQESHTEGSEATSWRKPSQGDQMTQASATSRGFPQESHREGSEATSWRKPSKGDQRTEASVTARGHQQESGGISRDFFRRPGKAAGKAKSDRDTEVTRSQDGPDAASWRNPQRSQDSEQAEYLDEDDDPRSSTEDLETFYYDSNSAGYADESVNYQRRTPALYSHKSQLRRRTSGPPFTDQELESFLDEKSHEALLKLVSQKDKLDALLSADDLDDNILLLAVRVLSCMGHLGQDYETLYTEEVSMVLSMMESSLFLSKHLTRYLVGLSTKQADDSDDEDTESAKNLAEDLHLILDILKLFLQRKPFASSEVGVVLILLQKVVTAAALRSSEFDPQGSLLAKVEELQECSHTLEESKKTARERSKEKPPPDNFRDIPIFPQSRELRQMGKPFLRKNIVRGRYDSVEHYLDVQFRLLREDFVAPLREGVTEFLSSTRGRLQDIRMYFNVFIESQRMETDGIVHTLKFELRRRRPERWEISKRLLYGSFVCLSSDNFKHIFCATVENRNLEDLQTGRVHVRFLSEAPQKYKGPFLMAESAAYFEAYRHVLQGLQQMNKTNFPFKKYIVDVACTVEPPAYLQGDDEAVYDLRPLVGSDDMSVSDEELFNAAYVPILDPENWPSAEDLHLDDSQLAALQTALTKEFAIIQGPPGTGKTYIGLKIVELLLHNTPWNNNQLQEAKTSPILVVCYTNHALDQFLEGIIEFGEENVVRVGSRSPSVKLEEKNLALLRKKRGFEKYIQEKERLKEIEQKLADLDALIQRTLIQLQLPGKMVLGVMILKDFMSPHNFKELSPKQPGNDKKVNEQRSAKLMKWLEVGDGSNEQEEESADQDHKELETPGDKDLVEMEDEGEDIQRERQINDTDDFIKDRDEQREALEREISSAMSAHNIKHTLDSKSLREMNKSDAMTDQQADRMRRIWKLELTDRWRLYRLWVKRFQDAHRTRLSELRERYETLSAEQETLKAQRDLEILCEANVVGMTTTGAARCRNVLQRLGPEVVVVEEAAEVLEAHIITTLTARCQHLILIGDHQQLRPNPTVYRLAKLFNLDTSLFERMINNGVPCKTLAHQHRMRPEISQLMKKHFYKRLHDHESVLDMENVLGMQHNMLFVDHQRLEDGLDDDRSRSNQHEAEVLVGLCKYLLDQGYDCSQITILTTYKGQLFCIRRLMDRSTFDGVRVSVVDNFQGEENDIILLSLVRSNEEGSIGFLRIQNRVCVALSRARMGFYCIGNFTILKKAPIWQDIIATLEAEHKIAQSLPLVCQNHPHKISEIVTAKDFKEKTPCGGCDKVCGYRLPCGHVCRLSCHPCDPQHQRFQCQKPCTKYCSREEHACPLLCHERCRSCQEKVQRTMPSCGHKIQVSCCQFEDISCPKPCEKLFTNCGHPCRRKCGERCLMTCPEKCEKSLACGHSCTEPCGESCNSYCKVKVQRILDKCGHEVTMDCSQIEISCPKPCPKLFQTCKHPCRKKCGERCLEACPEKCEKTLVCGHQCKELCKEPCISYCQVEVRKTLSKCGHKAVMECGENPKAFQCTKRVRKTHPRCGHDVLMDCCEDPGEVMCRTSVVKKRKSCGHQKAMLCYVNPDSRECTERCSKTLSCGHQCPNTCGNICEASNVLSTLTRSRLDKFNEVYNLKVCEEIVEKSYPSCSHIIKLPCHKDVSEVPCTEICRKSLPCGHRCPKKCSEPCPQERLSYSRIRVRAKYGADFSQFCRDKCEKVLSCGHVCPNKCGEPCVADTDLLYSSFFCFSSVSFQTKCDKPVQKKLPGCGHNAMVECHNDVSEFSCHKICGKMLSCGHMCPNKCGEPCPGDKEFLNGNSSVSFQTKCNKLVKKKLPGCGHTTIVKCHKDISGFSCSEICGKKLSCGHICKNLCGIPCICLRVVRKMLPDCDHTAKLACHLDASSYECKEKCDRILTCGHQCPNKCGEPCSGDTATDEDELSSFSPSIALARRCTEIVRKEFPDCNHSVDLPCFKDINTVKCSQRCEEFLPCGHQCPNRCGSCDEEDYSSSEEDVTVHRPQGVRCKENVRKMLPCGHSQDVACWFTDIAQACREPCTDILACGHRCIGNCDNCKQGKQHVACEESCKRQLLCGHICGDSCGEICPPDCSSCTEVNDRRERGLSRRTTKDVEVTPCTHKVQNRQLKSTACILRCTQSCPRGWHTCIGVCGEPCPPYCTVCSKRAVIANLPNKNLRRSDTFIYLPDCDHLCEARTLDKMVASFQSQLRSGCFEIRSILCPKCKQPIQSCSRYKDTLDIIKSSVGAAKQKCINQERRSLFRCPRFSVYSGRVSAAPSVPFVVGRWFRCPQGHVFSLEDDKQAGQQKLECPECSKE